MTDRYLGTGLWPQVVSARLPAASAENPPTTHSQHRGVNSVTKAVPASQLPLTRAAERGARSPRLRTVSR